MGCRFADKYGYGNMSQAVACYEWCIHHGAHVVTSSFGQYEQYPMASLEVLCFCNASYSLTSLFAVFYIHLLSFKFQ